MAEIDSKPCSKCGATKPLTEFYISKKSPKGVIYRRADCHDCVDVARRKRQGADPTFKARRYAYSLQWRAANPEKFARAVANWTLRNKYGIDVADYERMFAAQGGCCAICSGTKSYSKSCGRFHVDHCHATGKIRGILCQGCNTVLGKMLYSPELLRRAADYLDRHKPELVAA